MHELPVTQSILAIALESAQEHGARQVLAIDLVIGALSSIVDESVQFYFDVLSQGTAAAGATLRFHRTPAAVMCLDCGHHFTSAAPLPAACPQCGNVRLKATGGREFLIESIEVADENPGCQTDFER